MGFEHIDHVERNSMLSSPPHGSTTFPPGTWVFDPATSVVEVASRVFGLYSVNVSVQISEGVADVDAHGSIQRLQVSLTSDTATTGNRFRERHLRGPKYLYAQRWPHIDFFGRGTGDVVDGVIAIKGHRAGLRVIATEASLDEDGTASIAAHGAVDRRLIGLENKATWCLGYDLTFTLKASARRA